MSEGGCLKDGAFQNLQVDGLTIGGRRNVITTWEQTGGVTATLDLKDSGSVVLIHGTADNVIHIPAVSGTNTGAWFDFIVTTATGGGTTTTIAIQTSYYNTDIPMLYRHPTAM